MRDKEQIVKVIFKAIDELNLEFPKKSQLAKSLKTTLFGNSEVFDSLGRISFITSIEQLIQKELGISITLLDEGSISQKNSPFGTVGSLADYISSLLERSSNRQSTKGEALDEN